MIPRGIIKSLHTVLGLRINQKVMSMRKRNSHKFWVGLGKGLAKHHWEGKEGNKLNWDRNLLNRTIWGEGKEEITLYRMQRMISMVFPHYFQDQNKDANRLFSLHNNKKTLIKYLLSQDRMLKNNSMELTDWNNPNNNNQRGFSPKEGNKVYRNRGIGQVSKEKKW